MNEESFAWRYSSSSSCSWEQTTKEGARGPPEINDVRILSTTRTETTQQLSGH